MNILCPICKKPLYQINKSYQCINHHNFDIAKQGYLNLNLHNSQNTGDNPDMIKSRQRFLEKNYYSFLREEVNKLINENDCLIDLACGQGYYTSYFKAKDKIGIDLSKQGLKIAAKNDPNTLYLLSSIFHVPLNDGCADKIITIFAPIANQEICRLLKEKGQFILVRPDVFHLIELKEKIYDNPYLNQAEDTILQGLKLEKRINISQKATIDNETLTDLFNMTPYVHKTAKKDKEKLLQVKELTVTFAFIIEIYTKQTI